MQCGPRHGGGKRRREFIALLGGVAAIGPVAARGQQLKVWRIGMLENQAVPVVFARPHA
jgi:hypothetical protein